MKNNMDNYFRFNWTALLLGLLICLASPANLFGQIDQETQARKELEKRGIDEKELRQALLEKGVDMDDLSNMSAQEALEVQEIIEETVRELETQNRAQLNKAVNTSNDIKRQETVKVPSKDTTKRDSIRIEAKKDSLKNIDLEEVEIYGQQIFRNQSIKVYNQSQEVKPPSSYVLGPGDELIVSIWGLSRLDESMTINNSGFVSPYRMPRIFLKGFTFAQAEEILKDRFASYYRFRSNEFGVAINYSRTIEVNIFGEVKNYGGFTMPATNTAFNALVAAGGPTDIGSVRRITLRRDGEVRTIDVYAFINDPSVANDFYLQNNDIIQVPVAQNVVTIIGQVNRPFKYELLSKETLEDAVKFAGGFTTKARRNRIRVDRFTSAGKISIDVDYNDAGRLGRGMVLNHGDVIRIFELEDKVKNEVSIEGEVAYPGDYARVEDMYVSDLLNKAVVTPETRMDLAFLKRMNGDGTVNLQRINLTTVLENSDEDILLSDGDVLLVYAKSRYVDSTYFEVIGEVREPGTYIFDKSGRVTVYDAVVLSGGLTNDAQDFAYIHRVDSVSESRLKYIRVDLSEVIKNQNSSDNISLDASDKIVIGSKRSLSDEQYVDVVGAVKRPGRYPYGEGMTMVDVLSLAGGFTFSAASNRIDLFRVEMTANQATKTVIATVEVDRNLNKVIGGGDVEIQPFDQIVVREVPEFEFQQTVRVEGEVRYPGPYALTTDNERLRSVVERAGNLTLEAFPQGATLYRKMDSIGYVVIDLDQAMSNSKSKFNIILKDGDIINVPKQQDLVRITGYTNAAERYPERILNDQNGIAVPYHSGKNARFYVDQFAAGVAPNGDPCEITVEHANGQIERTRNFGLFRSYPKVKPGSIVRVGLRPVKEERTATGEEKEDVDWGKVFANSVAQATTILSLILLLQRID